MKVTDKYVLFFSKNDIFSNFYKCEIKYLDKGKLLKFTSSEQLFMYLKAKTFNDIDIADKILKSTTPGEAKKLGRLVRNYDDKNWSSMRFSCMNVALHLKFSQNADLRNELLSDKYRFKSFVEASPYDKIWGVGLSESDPRIEDEPLWLGNNLLGKCLDSLRDIYELHPELI